jgi:hypothetical protein
MKTVFVDGDPSLGITGTIVNAAFLNAVNNHRHSGLDEDGAGANDYAVATGAGGDYVIELSPALTELIPGMPIAFNANHENPGAATLKIDDLAAIPIKNRVSAALSAGDILSGQIVIVAYDGTNFQLIGNRLSAASQAEMEAATEAAKYVAPSTAKYHPGVAKAWIDFTGTGTVSINSSYNVSGLTDNGTGNYTISIDNDFSSENYIGAGVCFYSGAVVISNAVDAWTAASCIIRCNALNSDAIDPSKVRFVMFGDQ